MTFTMDGEVAAVLQATLEKPARRQRRRSVTCRPGVPHEYDAIAFGADVSRRAQSDRIRVLQSL